MRELEEAPLQLTVPNDPTYLRMVRLIVASAATDLEFSYDAIEDLRIVADELINLVMTVAEPGAAMRIGIFSGPEHFVFRGSARLAPAEEVGKKEMLESQGTVVTLDVLAEQIVASLVDSFAIETSNLQIDVAFSVRCPIGPSDG
jgi:hypothetical protein